jgi:valyl-tRNA synthetase
MYDVKEIEDKHQNFWEDQRVFYFDSGSSKPTYSIDVPPRYASASMHIGHAVHYSHIDFVARYKRMRGYNVFFPLCFDVNGIPIEERVERKMGITRKDIDRQEFIRICNEFAEQNITAMKEQFKKLGMSMDSGIYYQTNSTAYRRLTQISFIKLYKNGLIYRGEKPINWCPRCMTALADAEVVYENRATKLNYIEFELDDGSITVATTRPELLPTCQMVAVHPEDQKAAQLVGKMVKTPLFKREVEILADESVDPEFGTGVVMVCSIGDKEDIAWIERYELEFERGIDEEGRMMSICGKYAGMKVDDARDAIINDLRSQKLLIKQDELEQSVGTCWRCGTPVEFIVMKQWFLNVLDFKNDLLHAADEIRWCPAFMKIRLEDWVNSLSWDWVISRQRYFATPIPIWECESCGHVEVAEEEDCYVDPTVNPPPVDRCPNCGDDLKGCEDVFDTWMDSSITPLYNTYWLRDEEMFKKLYPMSLRPQAHDIIRTWAFYTILRGLLLTGEKPFREIMLDGFILAPDGTPMHASKGNVIDPFVVLDEYGADALRYYITTCVLGQDNAFRLKDVKHGAKLLRKIWNVEKFIANVVKEKLGTRPKELKTMDKWILSKYNIVVKEVTDYLDDFRHDKAMRTLENFLWHELADNYIEIAKQRAYDGDASARYTLYTLGIGIAKLFAPFFPHVTEEIYQRYYRKFEHDKSIHVSSWPTPDAKLIDLDVEKKGEVVKDIISNIRQYKSERGIALNAPLEKIEIYAGTRPKIETEDIEGATNTNVKLIEEEPKFDWGENVDVIDVDGITIAIYLL